MVLEARPAIVVEVMKQADDSPEIFVFWRAVAKLARAGAHASLDGERVLAQAFGFREFSQQLPSRFSVVGFIHGYE